MPAQSLKETAGDGHIHTRVYQTQLLHKEFTQPLNVVIIIKMNLHTQARAHVILFSSDLTLASAPLVDDYSLRFPIETCYQDSKGPLGFHAYRLRSAEAIGKHWCVVFVASSLWHLTCLPARPERPGGLIHAVGDACRHQGRAWLQQHLLFVHDQWSHGATIDHVFGRLCAKQRAMAPA